MGRLMKKSQMRIKRKQPINLGHVFIA
jgi:hypothetical protein